MNNKENVNMSRAEKIQKLTLIAQGALSPKALLPQTFEPWFYKEGVYSDRKGTEMSEREFARYRKDNPHRNIIRIQVKHRCIDEPDDTKREDQAAHRH